MFGVDLLRVKQRPRQVRGVVATRQRLAPASNPYLLRDVVRVSLCLTMDATNGSGTFGATIVGSPTC